MKPRLSRRIAVMVTAAAVALAGLAIPATAHQLKGGTKADRIAHARAHVAQAKTRQQVKKAKIALRKTIKRERVAAKRAAIRARKAARFVGHGTLSGIDGSQATVDVRRGTRNVRRSTLTVEVAEQTRIKLNGKRVALTDLMAGDRVLLVKGKGLPDSPVAGKLFVRRPAPPTDDDTATDTHPV